MSLTLKVTCNRCGETVESSLALQHACRRLTLPDVEKLIDKFLDDLQGRSGFAMNAPMRAMIRADWRWVAEQTFKDLPEPDPAT